MDSPPRMKRAAQLDLALTRWRAERARKAGQTPVVIPYTGYGSTRWVRVLGRVLLSRGSRSLTGEPAGARGWRSFTSVPVQGAQVRVTVEGATTIVAADNSGIVDTTVEAELTPGWHQITLATDDSPEAAARVYIVDPEARFGIVSDIDDTVMVTALPRPMLAAWHTFVVNEHARATTPGMPVLYERLAARHAGAPVVYLSTGAWNVAPTLTRFLSRNLYPAGALLLTDWGPTPDRWFRSGREHKQRNLERLSQEFPEIRWLLVGDDGQHDESIYGDFVSRHPGNVAAVCIRQLSPGEAVLAGAGYRNHSVSSQASRVPWLYAPDGAGLADELEATGLLEEPPRQAEVTS